MMISSTTLNQLIYSVDANNSAAFAQALQSSASAIETAGAATELLKHFTVKGRGTAYAFIMERLRDLFPAIHPFVARVNGPEGKIDVLSSLSIRMMISRLAAKGKIQIPCLLCENYNELEAELRNFAQSSASRIALIARNQNANATTPVLHVSPLLIEKKGTAYRCLITDSLGGGNLFGDMMAIKVSKILEKIATDYQILSYRGEARQIAPTNCPIFGMMDAIQFSACPDLFDYCHDQAERCGEKAANMPVAYFHTLPSAMMKFSQAIPEGSGRIEKKFLKYERIVIAQAILQPGIKDQFHAEA